MSACTALQTVTLLALQCARRFYETQYVQIFSSKAKINITHYIVGYFHYFGAFLAIISRAPGFVRDTDDLTQIEFETILPRNLSMTLVFLGAFYQQCRSNFILVNLRKNKKGMSFTRVLRHKHKMTNPRCLSLSLVRYIGAVVTEKHLIPEGSFFQFVSAPHMFFEIVMYTALTGVLYSNLSWWWVYLWVVSNQIENGWLTHKWYLATFKDYPKERCAILPGLL